MYLFTVTDNLVAQGVTGQNIVSIFFEPATEGPIGELTFGGVDPTKFVNEVYYACVASSTTYLRILSDAL